MSTQAAGPLGGGLSRPPTPRDPADRDPGAATQEWVVGLTRTEAEELLDWLEANGLAALEVAFDEPSGFAVRWR
jgi:hypothetical protein